MTAAERFAAMVDAEKRADFHWLEQMLKSVANANTLWGYAVAIAAEHQDWSFWQVLHEARKTFRPTLII
jgi:phage FluMu gp28-like protein